MSGNYSRALVPRVMRWRLAQLFCAPAREAAEFEGFSRLECPKMHMRHLVF
jgi:hypothetical protein